jgi:hypothetical protein
MIYYRDKHEFPLWNWLIMQANDLDVSYILKYGILRKLRYRLKTKKKKKILYETFETILFSMKTTKSDIYINLLRWDSQVKQLKLKMMANDKSPMAKLERVFRDYLLSIQDQYDGVYLTVNYFNPNWRKLIKKYTIHMSEGAKKLCMKLFKDFEQIGFYDWDQFTLLINDPKYYILMPFTLNEEWRKEFILQKEEKRHNIVKVDEALVRIFESYNLYEHYQTIRIRLFHFNNLKVDTKQKEDPFKQLGYLSKNIGFRIDPKKTNISEYETYLEIIQAERAKQEEKPTASGNK